MQTDSDPTPPHGTPRHFEVRTYPAADMLRDRVRMIGEEVTDAIAAIETDPDGNVTAADIHDILARLAWIAELIGDTLAD